MGIGRNQGMQKFVDEQNDRNDRGNGRFFQSPIVGLTVKGNTKTFGGTITFKFSSVDNITTAVLLRGFTKNPDQAKVLQTYDPTIVGANKEVSYIDGDASLSGKTAYYWVKSIPSSVNLRKRPQPWLTGWVSLDPQPEDLLPPDTVQSFSASESAGAAGVVAIAVTFDAPEQRRWRGLRIYVAGYQGIAADVLLESTDTSPFQFNMQKTGETVTLKAVSINGNFIEHDRGAALTAVLTLNGIATAPCRPTDTTVTDLLTSGAQVEFAPGAEANVTQFKIYRGLLGGGFASASLIGYVPASGSGRYEFIDPSGTGGTYEWYVVASNPAGDSQPSLAFFKNSVATSALLPPNAPSNSANFATVDSVDIDGVTGVTIRIYGATGGVGTAWTRVVGYGAFMYPSGQITPKAYATTYYIMWNGLSYVAVPNFASTVPDGWVFVGKLTTVAAGGTGGSSGGGGGGGGGGGCVEEGTPVKLPDGATETFYTEECSDWIVLHVGDREPVRMHPDTLVAVFKKAKDLKPRDLVEVENANWEEVVSVAEDHKKSRKVKRKVKPHGYYYARGIRLHNLKPI